MLSPSGSTMRTNENEETVIPQHTTHAPAVSDTFLECVGAGKGKEKTPGLGDQPQHAPSSDFAVLTDENKEMIITSIQATDVALGLRRLPAGFYSVVHHSGLEWRTENKRSLVNGDVVEWNDPIPIPSNLTATVDIEVYASFEFEPMLGTGEQLRNLTITVEQLLDRSAKSVPFVLFPKNEDVVSPCSSILVTVGWCKCDNSSSSRVLRHHSAIAESEWELEDATNQGHGALSCYQRHGGQRDLERSIEQFERALTICPLSHPCRAAAQSNLAMAKFIRGQVEHIDATFDVPIGLYHDALAARPVGHVDRPLTLVQLAIVHFARFEKGRDEIEQAHVETLLHEAMELSSAESHEKRVATFMLQLHAGRRAESGQPDDQSLMEQNISSHLTDADLETLSVWLLYSFRRFGDSSDLERAIAIMEDLLRSDLIRDDRHCERLSNLGLALLFRYIHSGKLGDLENAISRKRNAVELTPDGHPDKPRHLHNLGNSLRTRFERLGELGDLGDAISTLRTAVELTPHGHLDKPARLSNLGTSFITRFERLGELDDLENAILMFRDAVKLTLDGQSNKPAYLNNLGNSIVTRFGCLGEPGDLEDAISILGDAVKLTPRSHPDKPARLNNLGTSVFTRFMRLGELGDLENAISTLREAVELTPHGPDKPAYLNNLGNSIITRFECLGELGDLEDAILRQKDAVELTPNGHPDKSRHLNNLGTSFSTRFERLGELRDLEDAISTLRTAVELTPHGHPDKPGCLCNLGASFVIRFERFGELDDLDDAISTLRNAVELTHDGHPGKPGCLNNLGTSLRVRFEHLGKHDDLEDAISTLKNAVDLTPHGHPSKPNRLSNLGTSFRIRFEQIGEVDNLKDAISILNDAVDLTPDGHPDKPGHLSNLSACFRTRSEHLGELGYLEDAISTLRTAVELTPDGHPDKPRYLNNLSASFRARFERLGELGDLQDAISMLRDAIELTPHGHPDKPNRLSNLGTSLRIRFEHLGELGDLEDAISMLRDAVHLTPHGHLDKPARLSGLGNSFVTRFERLGELGDLEDAISTLRDAVEFTPCGHLSKPSHLNNLGNSIFTRFEHLGELDDLENAISMFRDAVELTPDSYPDKPSRLNNLGNSIATRFERLGELSDLEDAISTLKDAVELTPDGHPDKPGRLNNLGNSFATRFERLGKFGDLEDAVSTLRNAVELTHDGHPDKPAHLNNLGISLRVRFERTGELSDLEDAILRQKDAVALTPHDHPDKPRLLNNLGNAFRTRFRHLADLCDLEQAISLYSDAACATAGPIRFRFRASQYWISCARPVHHPSLFHAYSVAIDLLPQLAWIGLSLEHRYSELIRGADVVRDAAATALDLGLPETAIEWLEQGRSVVWGELFQLRSSYEELESVHPDHARALRQLSITLEHASVARENFSSLSEKAHGVKDRVTESLEQEANKHRTLAIQRDKLLQEIRDIPGFERFLLHKQFSQLRAAAHSGPVVILTAAEHRCDALIVRADVDHAIHVPLPNFALKRCVGLQNTLKSLLGTRVLRDEEREGKTVTRPGISWGFVLSVLWKDVVKPVLDALDLSTPGDLSRIFWCPTGPFAFLPIHAAGLYNTQSSESGHKVSDFVVSSYVPTLSVLTLPHKCDTSSNDDLRLLVVGQPPTDGQSPLPGVETELKHIRAVIQNAPSTRATVLESSMGTVEEVLGLMKDANWVHFACHGVQDAANPTDSGLCLANKRRLRVSDIIALSRPLGGLAFLSACQTATGHEELSDEAIHIAAGMLFAGYGSVIGTMWSISDRLAPRVARDVYEQLFQNTRPDYRKAARALHDAIGRVRDDTNTSFEWIPFIHVGL